MSRFFISVNIIIILGQFTVCGFAQTAKPLSMQEFIDRAVEKDTEFEAILLDEYALAYQPDLIVDAEDLILSVKNDHAFNLKSEEHDAEVEVLLSRLFRKTGTTISGTYTSDTDNDDSTAGIELSQDIARNAFGKSGRLKEKLADIAVGISRYQITEAYEDYLASLMIIYCNWYESYEKLRTATVSYEENKKLLENIKDRQQNKIALDIDVNKISVQVLSKQENMISLDTEYLMFYTQVKSALACLDTEVFFPKQIVGNEEQLPNFDESYGVFYKNSRTHRALELIEKQSEVKQDINADVLLPSIKLTLAYEAEGDGYGVENTDKKALAGVRFLWPFGSGAKERAEHEISKLALKKQSLNSVNTHKRLAVNIKNLSEQMQKEKQLIDIAKKKIVLAKSIVEDETENYSYGKVTLNDLIQEVNSLEEQKFSEIVHTIRLKKLFIEWKRLTDVLVVDK